MTYMTINEKMIKMNNQIKQINKRITLIQLEYRRDQLETALRYTCKKIDELKKEIDSFG